MRNTDFSNNPFGDYIDVEDDVRQYILMELKKIEAQVTQYTGDELFYLGLLYHEVGDNKSIVFLNNYLRKSSKGKYHDLTVQARILLAQIYIQAEDFDRASEQLEKLVLPSPPLLHLLFLETAKGYAGKGDRSNAIIHARKGFRDVKPELVEYLLDPLLAVFIVSGMIGESKEFVSDVCQNHAALRDYMENRLKQLDLINEPVEAVSCNDLRRLDKESLSFERIPENGKVFMLYFWSERSQPGPVFIQDLNRIAGSHHANGLEIVGICRLEEHYEESVLVPRLNEIVQKEPCHFTTLIDQRGLLGDKVGMDKIPYMALLDRKGRVRFFQGGGLFDTDLIERFIQRLLAEKLIQEQVLDEM